MIELTNDSKSQGRFYLKVGRRIILNATTHSGQSYRLTGFYREPGMVIRWGDASFPPIPPTQRVRFKIYSRCTDEGERNRFPGISR